MTKAYVFPTFGCSGETTNMQKNKKRRVRASVPRPLRQFSNPPRRVEGAPQFPKTKKRESYFQEFCSVTEAFQENRVKAHRLSNEAAELAMQVSYHTHIMNIISFVFFSSASNDAFGGGFDVRTHLFTRIPT